MGRLRAIGGQMYMVTNRGATPVNGFAPPAATATTAPTPPSTPASTTAQARAIAQTNSAIVEEATIAGDKAEQRKYNQDQNHILSELSKISLRLREGVHKKKT